MGQLGGSGLQSDNGVINYGGTPGILEGLIANRPAPGIAGRLFFTTDAGSTFTGYRDTGSAWQSLVAGGGTTYTPGSVLFADSGGNISQDNAHFFYDNTNKRLGINTNSPGSTLHVNGSVFANTNNIVLANTSGNVIVGSFTNQAFSDCVLGKNLFSVNYAGAFSNAIGQKIFNSLTTGGRHNAMGYNILPIATIATDIVAIGNNVLTSYLGTGSAIVIGNNGANGIVSGSQEFTLIGHSIASSAVGLSESTGMGAYALNSANGTRITAFGYLAGQNGSDNSLYIGHNAGRFHTSTGSMFLGNYDGTSDTAAVNSIFISDGAGNKRVVIPSSGNMILGGTSTDSGAGLQINNSLQTGNVPGGLSSAGGKIYIGQRLTPGTAVVLDTAHYIEIQLDGTVYRLALVI